MSFARWSAASLLVVCLLLLVSPLLAEYDILTRYDVPRPEGGRHFWLYSPTRYQLANSTGQQPLPLIFFFHGYTDQCELQGYISQFSIWAYVAEVHQYHIAVMCGTPPGPGWKSGYQPNTTGQTDDVAYTRDSLAIIKKAVNVKQGHVFAMGHSNGAMMSESHNNTTHAHIVLPSTHAYRTAAHSFTTPALFSLSDWWLLLSDCWRAMLQTSSTPSLPTPAPP